MSGAAVQTRQANPIGGVAWMLATGMCFVAVTAIVKHVGSDIPAAEAAFLRYALGLVFVIPMIGPMRQANFTKRQLKLFGFRGVAHTVAVILWFYAMARIPMAEVTAMNYLNPVYVTIAAAVVLGEKLPPRRFVAVGVALLGAFIILRPGMREIQSGHIAMLGTAALFAVSYLLAKVLSDEVPALAVVGMLSITVAVGLLPFAIAVWVTPTVLQCAWMFLVACFATAGHYCMTRAFAAAPLSVTQPVTFLQLVWATLMGALVFHEPTDGFVILGGGIIVASVTFISWREARARRIVTPIAPETKV